MYIIYKWCFEDYFIEFKVIRDLIVINRIKVKWNYNSWIYWKSGVWIDVVYYLFW